MMPTYLPRVAACEVLSDLGRQAASDNPVLAAEASFALGGCSINGSLTEQKYAAGVDHLRKAAELNHPGAIASLFGIQEALWNTASFTSNATIERTAMFDTHAGLAIIGGLVGLLSLNLNSYLDTGMTAGDIPLSYAWKKWRPSAYRRYWSSPQRLAGARCAVELAQLSIDIPAASEGRAAKAQLSMFLDYILQKQDAGADDMTPTYRESFYAAGGVDVNCPVVRGFTVLQCAVLSGNQGAVNSAILFGVDIDATGRTPGWTPLWLSVLTGQGAVAKLLLAKGASTNCRDSRTGATLLHLLHQLTAREDIENVLQAVLQCGGAVSVDTLANGITPLLACFAGWDYSEGEAARALPARGADPTFTVRIRQRPDVGASPLSLCALTLDYALVNDMLKCRWAAAHGSQPEGRRAPAAARVDAYLFILTRTEFYYRSFLGSRLEHALDEFLKLIVTDDMKKHLQGTEEWIAGLVTVALSMSRSHVVASLLRLFPCDRLPLSPSQRPLIQIAIERRMKKTTLKLLELGADLLATEPTGYTALHTAAHFYPEILLELVNHVEGVVPPARGSRTTYMKEILQAKDSRGLDVRSLLLLEGRCAEQNIMTELRERFELDMDTNDMPNGVTLTGFCVQIIAENGSVPISQLQYLLSMHPKPRFKCDAGGKTTLLGCAISGRQGSMFMSLVRFGAQ